MTDAVHRITYDATVDDAVDVALRVANRTQTFRRQDRRNIIVAGTAAGLVLVGWWLYTADGTTPLEFALIVAAGIAFGVIFALIFKRFFEKEIRKQQRALGICVIRNRHFSSPSERQTFLEAARRLVGLPRSA